MATAEVNTPAEDNVEFDYESVQKVFNINLKKSQDTTYPKTRKEYETIMSVLKNKKNKNIPNRKFYSISEENENILLYKQRVKSHKVIPVEECFNIIVEAHLTLNHGNDRATQQAVCRKYFVPFKWVKYLVSICNVCYDKKNKEYESRKEIGSNYVVDLYIKKIENVTDEKHQILFYVDRSSQYVFLRPLRIYAEKDEIAFELLKLFANFGAPKTIVTHLKQKVFQEALKALETLSLPYDMPELQESGSKELSERITKYIVPTITSWKKSIHSEFWTSALCTLQFVANTTNNNDNTSPYSMFFNVDPNLKSIDATVSQKGTSSSNTTTSEPMKPTCGECSQIVYRKYTCHICRNIFHFTCCERSQYLTKEKKVNRILSTCFTCKRI